MQHENPNAGIATATASPADTVGVRLPWETAALHAVATPPAVPDALGTFRDVLTANGLTKALMTPAGVEWVKATAADLPSTERISKERFNFVPPARIAPLGRWPDDVTVPDAVADSVVQAALHADAGFGSSVIAKHVKTDSAGLSLPLFGPSATTLTRAGCPEALSTATAAWGLAMTTLITAAVDRGIHGELTILSAARVEAHMGLLLSRTCWPAIAAAAWCGPVELAEVWHAVATVRAGSQATVSGRVTVREVRAGQTRAAKASAAVAEAKRLELERLRRLTAEAARWTRQQFGRASQQALRPDDTPRAVDGLQRDAVEVAHPQPEHVG